MNEITISEEARKVSNVERHILQTELAGFKPVSLPGTHVQLALNNATSPLQKRIEELEKQLFDLKRACKLCICPAHTTDETCPACVAALPDVWEEKSLLEKQLLAMREAFSAYQSWSVSKLPLSLFEGGPPVAVAKSLQALNSTPADNLASKYSKREVLEKCEDALNRCFEDFTSDIIRGATIQKTREALTLARKELETK